MTGADLIMIAILLPLIGAAGIGVAGRFNDNLRETVTLVTAFALAVTVWNLAPGLMAGERPGFTAFEVVPGIDIAFRLEPLGMLFAALASSLWIVNSVYSIGYMRGNKEKNQTRFYIFFAVSLSATMGIAFAGNLVHPVSCATKSSHCPPIRWYHTRVTRQQCARRGVYLGILLGTSIGLLLPAIIWTYHGGRYRRLYCRWHPGEGKHRMSPCTSGLLLVLFIFGVGKAAVMPVHRWLPAAMVAPTPVSALLHAVAVVKAGVFRRNQGNRLYLRRRFPVFQLLAPAGWYMLRPSQ